MAHPKHKISKQRRDKRRTHDKLDLPTLANCSNCGSGCTLSPCMPRLRLLPRSFDD